MRGVASRLRDALTHGLRAVVQIVGVAIAIAVIQIGARLVGVCTQGVVRKVTMQAW